MSDTQPEATPPAEVLIRWASAYQDLLHGSLSLLRPYFLSPTVHDDAGMITHQLSVSCLMSSESALYLIARERLWDAEILVRSVFEGSLKMAYLCAPDQALRAERHRELAHVLPEIGRLRAHERAQEVLAMWGQSDRESRPFTDLLISAEEAAAIKVLYPASYRQEVAQRWSFTGLVRALEAAEGPRLEGIRGLLHGYRVSSHLIHKDFEGISMVWERDQREPARREAAIRAHGARLCSDIHSLVLLRAHRMYRSIDLDAGPLNAWQAEAASLVDEWSAAYANWHDLEYAAE